MKRWRTWKAIGILVVGCGVLKPDDSVAPREGYTTPTTARVDGERQNNTVPITISVSRHRKGASLLADEAASAYSITIVCDSDIDSAGGNADELIVTNATANLRLYKLDQCTSTLTSVTVDGVTYTGTSNATQGAASYATFTDGGTPPNSLRVASTDILNGAEIASGDAIVYEFEAFDALSDNVVTQDEAENSDNTARTIEGVHAPRYTLAVGAGEDVKLTDVDANGSAILQINLVCGNAYVANTSCDGQAISQMDYWLVDASDSDGAGGSGSDFSDSVTYNELEALPSPGTAGTDLKADITAVANDVADVDGVTAGNQTGLRITATGPYAAFEHLDLFFALKFVDAADGNSYLFFKIDINNLTQ